MSLQLDMHKLNKDFILSTLATRLYNCQKPIIGLTGGIATGKSTVSGILKNLDIPLIDADKLVKNIYEKEESKDFVNTIDPKIMHDGKINFSMLRKLFFENSDVKNKIEAFIYNQMPAEFYKEYKNLVFDKYDFLIYDIPLLFEKKLQPFFDINVLVYSSQNLQRERLLKRDGIPIQLANKILHQQKNIEEKRSLSQFVLVNDSNIENLTQKVHDFIISITTQS